METKEKQPNGTFFAVLLFFAAALLFLFAKEQPSQKKIEFKNQVSQELHSGIVQDEVNRNLRDTSNQIEDHQLRSRLINTNLNQNMRDMAPFTVQDSKKPLPIEPAVGQTNSGNDLNHSKSVDYTTPRKVIQMELADKQAEQRAQEEFRREYVRQFVENAKKGGWRVEVDSNGNVKSVQPIKKPGDFNVFTPSASSSQ